MIIPRVVGAGADLDIISLSFHNDALGNDVVSWPQLCKLPVSRPMMESECQKHKLHMLTDQTARPANLCKTAIDWVFC